MSNVIGNHVEVTFPAFGDKGIKGKVDTGATMSSLDASDIKINSDRHTVQFRSPQLSDNIITMPIASVQTITSADGGDRQRPVISTPLVINGVQLKKVELNLNDRADMDDPLLIGQNILQQCNFVIDVRENEEVDDQASPYGVDVVNAVRVLLEQQLTLHEFASLVEYVSSQVGENDGAE